MLFQVKDLAHHCNVSPDTVRHYTKIGLLEPTLNPVNGYRQFNTDDSIRLNFIRRAKTLGFSLNEIKRILTEYEKGKSPCPMVRDLIYKRIKVNRARLEQLMELQIRMEQALSDWTTMSDGIPGEHSICQLIESFGYSHDSKITSQKKEDKC
jgi:MerR family transcriptional regulator, Zn(II)-responsive regulator of zntA